MWNTNKRLELILRSLGRKTLRGQQSDKKRQQQQMKTRGPPSKQVRVYEGHSARALFELAMGCMLRHFGRVRL